MAEMCVSDRFGSERWLGGSRARLTVLAGVSLSGSLAALLVLGVGRELGEGSDKNSRVHLCCS